MAASILLATGNTAAASSELVLAAGEVAVVCMKGAQSGAVGIVSLKDDEGGWQVLIQRLDIGIPLVLSGPATYRINRQLGQTFGVFRA